MENLENVHTLYMKLVSLLTFFRLPSRILVFVGAKLICLNLINILT